MNLWRRPRKHQADIKRAVESRQQAEVSLSRTHEDLAQTRAATPRYRAFALVLLQLQQENHLGEKVAHALREGPR